MEPAATSKPWYRSRTLWAAVATLLLTVMEAWVNGASKTTIVGITSTAVFVFLRAITTQGLLWTVALVGLLSVGATGCGTSTLQRMSITAQGSSIAWTRGYPVLDLACKAEASKCAVPGQSVPLAQCPGAAKCLRALDGYRNALDTVDRALLVGIPLAAVDSPAAAGYLSVALAAYEHGLALAKQWGLTLPPPLGR